VGAGSEAEVMTCIFGLLLLVERMQAVWGSASEVLAHAVIGLASTSVYLFVVARIKVFIPKRDKNVFDYLSI